jgi:hypothetical protein
MDRYWQENSLGYRDQEWTPDNYMNKQRVVTVGDSFTAGAGIQNPSDRYSDVLAAHLGDNYAVFNLGMPRTATPQQLANLNEFPLRPLDVIIWQYFLNDIESALNAANIHFRISHPPRLVRQSYLLNYFYEMISPLSAESYWDWIYDAYDDPAIWAAHEAELNAVVEEVESLNARLIVVIFPNMQDLERSASYVDQVAQVFETRGQNDILRLYDAPAAWNPADLMVSARDEHPSVSFHHEVGRLLYEQFFAGSS